MKNNHLSDHFPVLSRRRIEALIRGKSLQESMAEKITLATDLCKKRSHQ